jgi:phage-related holin
MKNFILNRLEIIIAFLVVYFSPTFQILFGIGFLVMVDFATGILSAKKSGEDITSKKMRLTIVKGFGYMSSILVAYVIQKVFIPEMEVMKIVSGLVAMIELKSLDENLTKITGKSLFKKFLDKNTD